MSIWSLNHLVELFMLYSDYTMTTLADYNRDRKGKRIKRCDKKKELKRKESERELNYQTYMQTETEKR